MKKHTKPIRTAFKIPNTPEGNAFIKQLREYAVPGTHVLVRGRGHRVAIAKALGRFSGRFNDRLPLQHAEYFAVYINKVAEVDSTLLNDARKRIDSLRDQIVHHANELATLNHPELKKNLLSITDAVNSLMVRPRRRIHLE